MKKFMLLCLLGFLATQTQAAPLPTHFITGSTIYYIGQSKIKLKLTISEASPESWAFLSVSAEDQDTYQPQEDEIHKAYPNLKIDRRLSRGIGQATIKIAALGISKVVDWEPYQNGPGLDESFELTKAQTMKVLTSQDLGLSISGKVQAEVNAMNIVETKTIPSTEYCSMLLKGADTVEQVFINYPAVSKMIDSLYSRFPDTKESLKKAAIHQCLEITENSRLESFKELLETKVSPTNPVNLIGETQREGPTLKQVDFSAELPKVITSRIGG